MGFGLRKAVSRCCFGLKVDETREGFLKVVSFLLGTVSASFEGDDSFRGMRASFAGGHKWELAWPPWRPGVPG